VSESWLRKAIKNSDISIPNISLVIPKANTSFGCLFFHFSAADDWNKLQKSLKLVTYISLTKFKRQLSEQLTDHCSCTQPICK
jgi:hypothetical protein